MTINDAVSAWSYSSVSERLKINLLRSKEHNLMFNKRLKENKCLKARKKIVYQD